MGRSTSQFAVNTVPRLQPLVLLLVAVSGGIVADRGVDVPMYCWFAIALVALTAWAIAWRAEHFHVSSVLILTAALAWGGAWHGAYWRVFAEDELGLAADEQASPVCVEAIALSSPRFIPAPPEDTFSAIPARETTRLQVQVTGVRDGRVWRVASGRATLVINGHFANCTARDRLQVFARLRKPSGTDNPGEFDFARFLRSHRELFTLRSYHPESVFVIQRGFEGDPRRMLARARQFFQSQFDRYLHQPQSELAAAVLLGAREDLSRDRVEDFFLTGTIHLLAISGLHVAILGWGFWWMLRLFAVPRQTAILIAALFFVSYALLVEARPPVVRATILIVAFCIARLSGRRGSTFNTLAAAALILLALNPTNLFRVGPQLSFLAVTTIAYFSPWLMRSRSEDPLDLLIRRSRPWTWRFARRLLAYEGSICVVTTLIWLIALPLVMYHFQLVAPIGLVLNPVIWIPMAVALFAGFGILIFGWWLPPVAALFGEICNGSLAILEGSVQWASQFEGGHFWVPPPALWWVAGFYAILAATVALSRHRFPIRWRVVILFAWIAVGCGTHVLPRESEDRLTCTLVSVGHGACTIVELPDGRTLMVDAGGMAFSESIADSISACLWSRGITHLDAVVLSHADADHYSALPELMRRFSVGVVYVSPVMFRDSIQPLEKLREEILDRGVEIRHVHANDRFAAGAGVEIEVWHPPENGLPTSDNANSLVLSIAYAGVGLLLPADLESPGLDDVLAEIPRVWQIVSAPHHGSGPSNQQRFAEWANPDWVVISGSDPKKTAETQAVYKSGGATVLHTACDGAIRIVIEEGQPLQVSRWQDGWETMQSQ